MALVSGHPAVMPRLCIPSTLTRLARHAPSRQLKCASTLGVRMASSGRVGKAGTAWVEGEGYLGCLGTGDFEARDVPVPIPSLVGTPVASVSAGWGHSAAVCEDGQLLVWGRTHDISNTLRFVRLQGMFPRTVNWMNRLSGGSMLASLEPAVLDVEGGEDVKFSKVACSPGAITAAVSEDGNVYCIGSNTFGECGCGHTETNVWDWAKVIGLDDSHIVDVKLGFAHTLALGSDGRAYAWGKGERGQVGLGDKFWYKEAVPIMGQNQDLRDAPVVAISAGFNHSAMATDDGKAYVWGKMQALTTDEGGLHGDEVWPRQVEVPGKVVDVVCGQAHTCFLTADGDIYMTGMMERGQWHDRSVPIPEGEEMPARLPKEVQMEPVPVDLGLMAGKAIKSLHADVHHTYAITEEGEAFWWGWRRQAVPLPTAHGKRIIDLARGLTHTLLIVDDEE